MANPKRTLCQKRSARRWLLAVALGLALSGGAQAQIKAETPRRVDAEHRRMQREARRIATPYTDSHLDISRTRLQRGDGDQPRPDGADALRYRHGAPVTERTKRGFLGLGRKKK